MTGSYRVAAGILSSRITGLLRESLMARLLGTTIYADAVSAAFKIPNLLQNLLGEGTLSAAFIPEYSRLSDSKEVGAAGALARRVLWVLSGIIVLVVAGGMLLTPVIVAITLPGLDAERRALTIMAGRIAFLMTGVLVYSAWSLAILNAHRRFFTAYVAPVVWNLAMIVFLAINYGLRPNSEMVKLLMWTAVAGAVLQLAVQLPTLFKVERHLTAKWTGARQAARGVLNATVPTVFGRGAVQISGYIDYFLVSFLAAGTMSIMRYSQMLYLLPISLLGFSVAAAELPELSRMREMGTEEMVKRARAALRVTWFWSIPVVVAFLAFGDGIVGVLLQGGSFERNDTRMVYAALAAYTIGLLPANGGRVLVTSLYAMGDTRTPARISIIRIAVSALLSAALMFLLLRAYGGVVAVLGICVGSAVGSWAEFFLLRRAVSKQLAGSVTSGLSLRRIIIVCVPIALALRALIFVLPERYQENATFVAPFIFGAAVLVIGMMVKLPEFVRLANVIRRRKS
ncbi:MAG TPA: murein biosynthesis integral membrane protein MurJ [Longimicrobiales bacterium]|nr:murein biosynthesis integral membrane protein MurJ [Longimicrobiales bacterium]